MEEVKLSENDTFIAAWILDNPTISDRIVNFFEDNIHLAAPGQSAKGIDLTIKNSTDMSLNDFGDIRLEYYNELQKVCDAYVGKYPFCNKYDPWTTTNDTVVQKYNPGGGYYPFHTERFTSKYPFCNRHLVFITYLNDVEDCGETEFYHQKIKIKPRKGLTTIFPADWTHTHRGVPSYKETKYILTGWFNFNDCN